MNFAINGAHFTKLNMPLVRRTVRIEDEAGEPQANLGRPHFGAYAMTLFVEPQDARAPPPPATGHVLVPVPRPVASPFARFPSSEDLDRLGLQRAGSVRRDLTRTMFMMQQADPVDNDDEDDPDDDDEKHPDDPDGADFSDPVWRHEADDPDPDDDDDNYAPWSDMSQAPDEPLASLADPVPTASDMVDEAYEEEEDEEKKEVVRPVIKSTKGHLMTTTWNRYYDGKTPPLTTLEKHYYLSPSDLMHPDRLVKFLRGTPTVVLDLALYPRDAAADLSLVKFPSGFKTDWSVLRVYVGGFDPLLSETLRLPADFPAFGHLWVIGTHPVLPLGIDPDGGMECLAIQYSSDQSPRSLIGPLDALMSASTKIAHFHICHTTNDADRMPGQESFTLPQFQNWKSVYSMEIQSRDWSDVLFSYALTTPHDAMVPKLRKLSFRPFVAKPFMIWHRSVGTARMIAGMCAAVSKCPELVNITFDFVPRLRDTEGISFMVHNLYPVLATVSEPDRKVNVTGHISFSSFEFDSATINKVNAFRAEYDAANPDVPYWLTFLNTICDAKIPDKIRQSVRTRVVVAPLSDDTTNTDGDAEARIIEDMDRCKLSSTRELFSLKYDELCILPDTDVGNLVRDLDWEAYMKHDDMYIKLCVAFKSVALTTAPRSELRTLITRLLINVSCTNLPSVFEAIHEQLSSDHVAQLIKNTSVKHDSVGALYHVRGCPDGEDPRAFNDARVVELITAGGKHPERIH